MWIYILVGVLCNLIGALTMWLIMKPHVEGAIVIENNSAYLQLNHEIERLADHQYVTFMVISRK